MEKELYNDKNMTTYDLKDVLINFPINNLWDYFEITKNETINRIFYEDVKILTKPDNNTLKFYLKDKTTLNYSIL